jgi:hypothetical protein
MSTNTKIYKELRRNLFLSYVKNGWGGNVDFYKTTLKKTTY